MKDVLTELLPRKARLVLYLIVFVLLLILAAWQASEGDWLVFAATLLGSLAPLLAAGNISPPEVTTDDVLRGVDAKELLAELEARGYEQRLL